MWSEYEHDQCALMRFQSVSVNGPLMLERLLKLRWPISAVLSDETITKQDDRYLDLTTEQWKT